MDNKKQPNNIPNAFIKYSSIGMQMLAPILLGYWGGLKLDDAYETGRSWTISLSLFGVFSGLYLSLRQLIQTEKSEGKKDPNQK